MDARVTARAAEMPLRVHELSAEEVTEWDRFEAQQRPGVDLVNCRPCRNRSGTMCTPLHHAHVPLELNHRCAHYAASKRRAA